MVEQLKKQFTGVGEVKGFEFTQINYTELGYIYEVDTGNSKHYEVFKRLKSPVCIDFDKRVYSDTDFKESYPKSNSFGDWAWCCSKLVKAQKRLDSFKDKRNEED